MQVNEKVAVGIAQSPFRPGDDRTADFVLQASDNVRFWLCKAVVARASPVFMDMFSVPHPPQDPAATTDGPDSEYVDGKPIVRVTEDAAIVDVFMRCCYPVLRPALEATQLTSMLEVGDKYDAVAVRGYARQEVARYALQTKHCLRAYLIAYRYGMWEEMRAAAKQTLHLEKQAFLDAKLPENSVVPVIALTQLQDYRKRCLNAAAILLTPKECLEFYGHEQPPMWDLAVGDYQPADTECTCNLLWEPVEASRLPSPIPFDEDPCPWPYRQDYAVKTWFSRYLWSLRESIKKDVLPIRLAVLDPDAMGAAVQEADKCKSCQKGAAKGLLGLLKCIGTSLDERVAMVPISMNGPRGTKRTYEA